MAGFEDYLAGAGTGALSGFAAGGPVGAAIGGITGLIGSAFKKDPEQYHDPFEQQRLAAANDMEHSTLGETAAANAATKLKQNAMDSYEGIKDNPNFQGNASVQSAAYGKAMRGAQSGIVDANIAGAQTDEATHERGANMLSGIQKDNYQTYLGNQAQRNKPDAMDTIAQTALGKLAGKGIEGLGGGADSPGGEGDNSGNSMNSLFGGKPYGFYKPDLGGFEQYNNQPQLRLGSQF